MTQKTVGKRISPRASVKTAPVAKPRRAVAIQATRPMAMAAGALTKFYTFVAGARPSSGPRLVAHTNAVLVFLGLDVKKPVKREAVKMLLGPRAMMYHIELGNFAVKSGLLSLTTAGYAFFKNRVKEGHVNPRFSEAFLAAIQRGKLNDAAHIMEGHLVPVSMQLR